MKRGIILSALALVSLLALNGTVFMAFASKPTVVVDPVQGYLGMSYSIYITATPSEDTITASSIQVTDPDGDTWELQGEVSPGVWVTAKIWLPDVGDEVQLIWPETSGSIVTKKESGGNNIKIAATDESAITDLAWRDIVNDPPLSPHTSEVGTYVVWMGGSGCAWIYNCSFYSMPEGPLGTISFLLVCVASLAIYKRVRRPQVKL